MILALASTFLSNSALTPPEDTNFVLSAVGVLSISADITPVELLYLIGAVADKSVLVILSFTALFNCNGLTALVVSVPVATSSSVAIWITPFCVFVASLTEIVAVSSTSILLPTITPPIEDEVAKSNVTTSVPSSSVKPSVNI